MTSALGTPDRSVKLQSDMPGIRYQNGYYVDFDGPGNVHVRDKDGKLIGDLRLSPHVEGAIGVHLHDIAMLKDGGLIASWIYALPHSLSNSFSLVRYDPSGNFLDQIDLGEWRALKICVAEDKSIWTLSEKERFRRPLDSPDEGVLRNYKFGSGLVREAVPRSNFAEDSHYASGRTAIDCSGGKIHALTEDGQWFEYTPGGDFTITKIEPFSHATFGDYWQLTGFAYLGEGHEFAVIHSVPGDPFRRTFAELLPTGDGKMLCWTELPESALPADAEASGQTPSSGTYNEPASVTGLLGVENGELIYRTSVSDGVLWSKPVFK